MKRLDFLARCFCFGAFAFAGRSFRAPPLGVQLYTIRSLMARDARRALALAREVGYLEVEFAGYHGHAPRQLANWLGEEGLSAPAAHVGLQEIGPDINRALDDSEALGHRWLVLPYINEERRTPDGYARTADELNRAGGIAAERGIRIAYHNHGFEFERLENGSTGFDILASQTDPASVDLEIDLHWSAAAGISAAKLFERYPGRYRLCHLKGMAAGRAMVAVGEGIIDWPAILALSGLAGMRHFFVEHDAPADPAASIISSFRYLSQLDWTPAS